MPKQNSRSVSRSRSGRSRRSRRSVSRRSRSGRRRQSLLSRRNKKSKSLRRRRKILSQKEHPTTQNKKGKDDLINEIIEFKNIHDPCWIDRYNCRDSDVQKLYKK